MHCSLSLLLAICLLSGFCSLSLSLSFSLPLYLSPSPPLSLQSHFVLIYIKKTEFASLFVCPLFYLSIKIYISLVQLSTFHSLFLVHICMNSGLFIYDKKRERYFYFFTVCLPGLPLSLISFSLLLFFSL